MTYARLTRRAAILFVMGTVTLVAGCSDTTVADRLRASGSPSIQDVTYKHANLLDPALTIVWLTPGATDADADRLWCDVIVPAGGESLEGAPGAVSIVSSDGGALLGAYPAC